MQGAADWHDRKFDEVFEQETRGLERRRQSDPACTIAELRGQLKHLYVLQGHDWDGRGELSAISLAASVAAYESFIAAWEAETVTGGRK